MMRLFSLPDAGRTSQRGAKKAVSALLPASPKTAAPAPSGNLSKGSSQKNHPPKALPKAAKPGPKAAPKPSVSDSAEDVWEHF
jgi:hypothetical protein